MSPCAKVLGLSLIIRCLVHSHTPLQVIHLSQSLRHSHSTIYALKLNLVLVIVILLIHLVAEPRIDLKLPQPPPHVVSLGALPPDQGRGRVHLEAVAPWRVALDTLGGDEGRVDLEEDVVEGGAEVGAVDSGVA